MPKVNTGIDGELFASEENKERTYVIMSQNPVKRLMDGFKLSVIPLCGRLSYGSPTFVSLNGVKTSAMLNLASTAEKYDNSSYVGVLKKRDVDHISWNLKKILTIDNGLKKHNVGSPGSIVEVPWDMGKERQVLIVGSSHLNNKIPNFTVLVTPVDTLNIRDDVVEGVELKALACQRMRKGTYKGHLCLGDVLKIQKAALQAYGVN